MGFSEALIIYLAIGAPFGVYVIVRGKGSIKQNVIALLTANILFWPVFASLELVPRSNSASDPKYFTDERPSSISAFERTRTSFKASLENIGDRGFRRSALEGFERYAALKSAHASSEPELSDAELYEIAAHPNAKLASKCLARKNRTKLANHRDRAETELKALSQTLATGGRTDFELAIRTAKKDLEISVS